MIKGIKLILFDLDGTIVDSKDVIVESFVKAARIFGIRIDPEKVRKYIGYPIEEVVANSLIGSYNRKLIEEFINVRRRIMEELWPRRIKLYPDVKPALEKLSKKYILGIASSSVVERIYKFIRHLGVASYFKVVSGRMEGIRGKPYPDVIIYAMNHCRVGPESTVYIGDAEIDCITARNANVRFIRILREDHEDEWVCKPDYTIESLTKLLDLLD